MRPEWNDLLDEFYSFGYVGCPYCGSRLTSVESMLSHWSTGHFDFEPTAKIIPFPSRQEATGDKS